MNISFENKRILVTGAGKGLGRAITIGFAHSKAEKVFALSRDKSNLEDLISECPKGVIQIVHVDLCDWNATRSAVMSLGTIHCLVNCAGITILESFLDIKPESFDNVFSVNVKQIINVSQVVAESMISAQKGGTIVNISSQASKVALKDHTVYSASKGAVDAMTRAMTLELGPHNIRVNAINPTIVMTDMGRKVWSNPKKSGPILNRIPLHKFAEVDDIVNAVLFLSSDKSDMINGVNLPIDGGLLAV